MQDSSNRLKSWRMLVSGRGPWWVCTVALSLGGCGLQVDSFPNALIGSDGSSITLDQVLDIVNDDDRTEEQQRDALRELGIEDEVLIDSLLTL